MSSRAQYAPGPAAGAEIRKDAGRWTLVLVRDLAHPPAMVWQALTDPAQLREWAPFDADRSLGNVGTVQLTTVGTPQPHVTETKVSRADRRPLLEFNWGGQEHPLGAEARRRAALGSRSGTTSTVATSRWVPRVGTSASTCWSGCSTDSPSGAWSART